MTVRNRLVDEVLVISVTGSMTRRHGIDELKRTLEKAIQQGRERILLDLEPREWDSYGFEILDSAIQALSTHQGKVVCRLDQIPLKDFRWIRSVYSKADCFETLERAIAFLREDC